MTDDDDSPGVSYILVCRECGNPDLPMSFGSEEERARWAAGHAVATGHYRWLILDQPAS